MKKLVLALIVIAGLGSTAVAQSKVAHVNTKTLLDTMPSRKAAALKLEDYRVALEDELKEMEADYMKAKQAYIDGYGDMTQTMKAYKEKSLGEKEQRIIAREQTAQQELMDISNDLNAPLLSRVQDAIAIVAEKMKLSYVMDESNALYSAGGTDITAEVVVELMKLEKEAMADMAPVTPN